MEYSGLIVSMPRKIYAVGAFRVCQHEQSRTNGTLTQFRAMTYAYDGGLECSDHRDYVYVMLGMANDEVAKLIVANHATLTARNGFVQVTRHLLCVHGPDVLRYCYFRAEKCNVELPSWVPQWNAPVAYLLPMSTMQSQLWASSGLLHVVKSVKHSDDDRMALSGAAIDRVVSFADLARNHSTINEWRQRPSKMIENSVVYRSLHEMMEAV